MRDSAWRIAPLVLALLTLISATSALAAQWTVIPDITVRETYTDRPSLTGGAKDGDFITEVTPGLRIQGRGARFRANMAYRPSAIFYARNSRANDVANRLNAFANLEAVERFFFVDVFGNISQHFISPFAERPADITTISPNRTETRSYGISPYVRGEFARDFSYEARNRNTWTKASTGLLADAHTREWTARVASPIRRFGWALEYDDTRISFQGLGSRPDLETRLYRGRLFFQPDPELRLSASIGHEENNYALQQKRSYAIYGAGLGWRPTPRTTADLQWERRFFGSSRLASLAHRTRLTAWRVAYSRTASDYPREVLRLPPGDTAALLDAIFAARIADPIERQAAVERFLAATGAPEFLATPLAFYTQRIFLRDELEASVGLLGRRNSVTLTGFTSKSTSLTSGADTILPDAFAAGNRIRQQGVGLNFSHQLAPFTSAGAHARTTIARHLDAPTARTRNDYLALSLTHRLSPKTNVFGGLAYTRFHRRDTPTSDAKSAFAGLYHRF
jgi:uncharacterized protein (PEP-CTERM system associated)